jgi:hypothetical protein
MNMKQMVIIGGFLFLSMILLIGGRNSNDQMGDKMNPSIVEGIDQNTTNPDQEEYDEVINIDDREVSDIEVVEPTFKKQSYYRTMMMNSQLTDQHYLQVIDKQIPLQIRQISMNYSKGAVMTPKYIVIHETNNYSAGADANAHYRYWNTNPTAQASTHFVVDNNEIYQMLQLDQVGWHVGDNRNGHSDITNFNSIGIEIAVNSDGDYYQARQNSIKLTINVMNLLDMDISQLKRHYDASGKWCPKNMLDDPSLWTDFVNQVEKGLNNK